MARARGGTDKRERESRSDKYRLAGIGLLGALVGTVVSFVATIVATSAASDEETGRQLREMKQQQYTATYRAVDQEILSFTTVFNLLKVGDSATAMKELSSYTGRPEVTGQLASLPLVADTGVLNAGVDLIKKRDEFLQEMGEVAKAFDAKVVPDPERVKSATAKLDAVRGAESDLLVAMRLDLKIP